jgi:hypothetical protein
MPKLKCEQPQHLLTFLLNNSIPMFLARRLRVCPQAARRRYEYQFPDPSERISVEDVVLASPERTYPLAVAFLVRAKLTGANFALVMDKLQTQQEVEKVSLSYVESHPRSYI